MTQTGSDAGFLFARSSWNQGGELSAAGFALGSLRSAKKAAAARENGRKGGRPRKTTIE